jgi:hypothetical protein
MAGLKDHNFPAFDRAEQALHDLGHDPVSPAALSRDAWAWYGGKEKFEVQFNTEERRREYYMRYDLPALLSCQGVALLAGWYSSRGATLEALVARQAGLKIFLWQDEKLTAFEKTTAQYAHQHATVEAGPLTGVVLPTPKTNESVLLEADRLVDGARQKDYGHPLDNYERVADLWKAYLRGVESARADVPVPMDITADDVAQMMILLKIGRLMAGYHRDSLVDIGGYAKVHDMIHTEREKRNAKS